MGLLWFSYVPSGCKKVKELLIHDPSDSAMLRIAGAAPPSVAPPSVAFSHHQPGEWLADDNI